MEKVTILSLWKECNKFLQYGVLYDFLSQMSLKKPNLVIESCQFIEFKEHSCQVGTQYYSYIHESLDFDDFPYKVEDIIWVYFNAFDTATSLSKTIKVQFLEQNKERIYAPKKILYPIKEKLISLQRNDLLLKIYDYFYLSFSEEARPQYFVIESEFINRVYTKRSEEDQQIVALQKKCVNSFFKQLGFVRYNVDEISRQARFYQIRSQNNHLESVIKMSPIDSLIEVITQNDEILTTNYKDVKNRMISNSEQPEEAVISINYEIFQKENIVKRFNQLYPTFRLFHDSELIELISSYPKYVEFSLEYFNEDLISFKARQLGQADTIKCKKYSTLHEAERVYKLFQELKAHELFHPETECEIIIFETSTYLFSIERDFGSFIENILTMTNCDSLQYVQEDQRDFITLKLTCWLYEKQEKIIELVSQQTLPPIRLGEQLFIKMDEQNHSKSQIYFKNFLFNSMTSQDNHIEWGKKNVIRNIKAVLYWGSHNSKVEEYLYAFLRCLSEGDYHNKILYEHKPPHLKSKIQKLQKLNEIQHLMTNLMSFKVRINDSYNISLVKINEFTPETKIELEKIIREYVDEINCDKEEILQILSFIAVEPVLSVNKMQIQIGLINEQEYKQFSQFCKVFSNLTQLTLHQHFFNEFYNILKFLRKLRFSELKQLVSFRIRQLNVPLWMKRSHIHYFLQTFETNNWFTQINFRFSWFVPFSTLLNYENFPKFKILDPYLKINLIPFKTTQLSSNSSFNSMSSNLKNLNQQVVVQSSDNQKRRIQKSIRELKNEIFLYFPVLEFKEEQIIKQNSYDQVTLTLVDNSISATPPEQLILSFNLRSDERGNLVLVNFQARNMHRYSSRCFQSILSEENGKVKIEDKILEIVKQWQINEYHAKTMRECYLFDEIHECIHSDYNQFAMKFYKNQKNLQQFTLDLRYCEEVIHQLNHNSDYLGLDQLLFLRQIELMLPDIDISLIKGIYKNIKSCKHLNTIILKCYYNHFNQFQLYLQKIPFLVQVRRNG